VKYLLCRRCAGLVFGFLFGAQKPLRLRDDTLAAGLQRDHDWIWLHLALSDHRARRFLESFADMPSEVRALMLGAEDRVQFHLTAQGAWGVLPDIEQNFAGESLGAGRFSFWLDATRLITARRHPLRATETLRDAVERGAKPECPA